MLSELAHAVRSGTVTPLELVDEAIRRIEAGDGDIGAVVRLEAESARRAAADHDGAGALAGLPVLVKDMARCEGSVTTFGTTIHADAPPDDVDDAVVARLREAGAIVVGRTNSPAFGHAPFTTNLVFGATRNPWNTELSPGGSSGGSAAALAAGFVPIATTSDGGGSVRIPASLCGLVGLKPTTGSFGRNVLPRWIELSTQGVTGHTVADVTYQAEVVAGPAPGDWLSAPTAPGQFTPTRPARVLACRTFRADVDPVIEAAFEASLDALAASGLVVERIEAPCDGQSLIDWFFISSCELAHSLADERDRWDAFDDSLHEILRFGITVTTEDYLAATRRRHALGARIDDAIGAEGVLAVPTLNVQGWGPEGPTPSEAGSVEGDPTIGVNTPDLNLTGHPAVSVPMGVGDLGLPMGLQLVAPRWADGLALGVAEVLEQARPWPLLAPGYEPFPIP
ncbi:amidase [Dermatobacter hominis]|uniref:amidase n=1 Tax=Dermatobacter hominis TaxID=2884263 RepID=UPI001D0FD829|nr:amidase [Dermatobacter hominis]UDY34691.1 amidase [Dermatobacter hominis]